MMVFGVYEKFVVCWTLMKGWVIGEMVILGVFQVTTFYKVSIDYILFGCSSLLWSCQISLPYTLLFLSLVFADCRLLASRWFKSKVLLLSFLRSVVWQLFMLLSIRRLLIRRESVLVLTIALVNFLSPSIAYNSSSKILKTSHHPHSFYNKQPNPILTPNLPASKVSTAIQAAECSHNTRTSSTQTFAVFVTDHEYDSSHGAPYGTCSAYTCTSPTSAEMTDVDDDCWTFFWSGTGEEEGYGTNCIESPEDGTCGCEDSDGTFVYGSDSCTWGSYIFLIMI